MVFGLVAVFTGAGVVLDRKGLLQFMSKVPRGAKGGALVGFSAGVLLSLIYLVVKQCASTNNGDQDNSDLSIKQPKKKNNNLRIGKSGNPSQGQPPVKTKEKKHIVGDFNNVTYTSDR